MLYFYFPYSDIAICTKGLVSTEFSWEKLKVYLYFYSFIWDVPHTHTQEVRKNSIRTSLHF